MRSPGRAPAAAARTRPRGGGRRCQAPAPGGSSLPPPREAWLGVSPAYGPRLSCFTAPAPGHTPGLQQPLPPESGGSGPWPRPRPRPWPRPAARSGSRRGGLRVARGAWGGAGQPRLRRARRGDCPGRRSAAGTLRRSNPGAGAAAAARGAQPSRPWRYRCR